MSTNAKRQVWWWWTFSGLLIGAAGMACGIRTPLTDGIYEAEPVEERDAAPPVTATGLDASPPPPEAATADAAGDGSIDDGGSPDVALPPANLGNVFLTSGAYASGAVQTLAATAVFFPSVAATGCTIAGLAGCTIETCADQTPPLTGAGAISVTGGVYPLVLEQGVGGLYFPSDDGGALNLWHGGEQLVVNASGDTVPSFTGTVVAPTQLTVLTPTPVTIPREVPFALSWFGQSAGRVAIDLSLANGQTDYYLECQFDVAAGAGSIPSEVLSAIPAGTAGFTVSTVNRSDVVDSPWIIRVFAQTNANDETGLEYSGVTDLE